MRSPTRARFARVLATVGLLGALLLPASSPVAGAQGDGILRVGTDQEFSGLNPWHVYYVLDYEVMTLNYDLLVGYDQNLQFTGGFAESWETSADGKTTTFRIRPGMTWSDGRPATAEDARYTYQLALDGINEEVTFGYGYLDGYLAAANISAVSAPDAETLVVETSTPTSLLIPAYVPILPKHVWEGYTLQQIANAEAEGFFANDPPVIGTGPYLAVEYVPGQFMRFERNESYWGKPGAADQVIIQHFESGETMAQALRNGEIDYARGLAADAFDALEGVEHITTVEGNANGYSFLAFNGYPNPIEGGGSSTRATADPAFRDALGYAVDLPLLVDRVLAGHGTPGTSLLPPFHANWYVPPAPDALRSFDLAAADQRLTAAGYVKDSAGKRLDKDGKPITLRLTWPASEAELATVAQFITEWWGSLGITVQAGVTEDDTLVNDLLPPEYDPPGKAAWDTYMWGWVGDVDPNSLLQPFTTDEIGGSSDTFWSNARFDELFVQQGQTQDPVQRKAMIQEMQELFYAELPNIPLYYDSELHAYRTDNFSGWQNQPPETGTPLFQFGPIGYLNLTTAGAEPTPGASASAVTAPSPGASPSADGGTGAPASNNTTGLLLAAAAVVGVVVVGGLLLRQRRSSGTEEE
jgi:peptide/nickel transport system substrate-binding protein